MTQTGQTAITPAAEGLLIKLEGIHQLLFKTAHMCARAGLGNLRRQLVKGLVDVRLIQDGLRDETVQKRLRHLQDTFAELQQDESEAKADK